MNATQQECNETAEAITFHCEAPQAATVFLIGEFNNWNPRTHPMRQQADGSWSLQVPLARGRHYYQFVVDGEPVLDPTAMYLTLENPHEKVSFIIFG